MFATFAQMYAGVREVNHINAAIITHNDIVWLNVIVIHPSIVYHLNNVVGGGSGR